MPHAPKLLIRPAIAVVVLFFVGASACGGCGGCGSDDQIGEMAENFPADTEAAFGVQSLEVLLEAPEEVIDTDWVSDDVRTQWREGFADGREDLEELIGIDPGDADAWEEWGIDVEGPIFVGLVDTDPIACLPVADEDDLRDFLLDPVATKLLEIDDAEHAEEEVDGHAIHTIGDELAWAYSDDAGCLAVDIGDTDPVDAVASFMDGPDDDDSLADQPGFENFADGELPGSLLAVYVSNEFIPWDEFTADPYDPAYAALDVRQQLDDLYLGYGSTVSIDDDIFRLRLWGGMNDDNLETTRRTSTSEHDMDWSRFATEHTSAAYRISLHPENMWDEFRDQFDDMDIIDGVVDELEREFDGHLDVEKDLVGNLSGHFGLFVYDIDPESIVDVGGPDLERGLEWLAVLQFVDADAMTETLDDIVSAIDAEMPVAVAFEALDDNGEADDIEVLEVPMVGMRLYRSDDLLVVANRALSESEVASYIRGERAEDAISDSDAVLGAALEDDHFNGLYLSERIWPFVEEVAQVQDLDGHLGEVLFHGHVTDSGVAGDVEFYPAATAVFGIGTITYHAFDTYLARSKTAESDHLVAAIADGATAYYEGNQIWSTDAGAEPWHAADADSSMRRPGRSVGFDDKVFPGGPNITVKTSEDIPAGGEMIDPDPVLVGDVDFEADDVLRMLNVSTDMPLAFRYTYETGPGTGDDATATIRAEANFDPGTSEHHTVIQTLEAGDWGVERPPSYVEFELQ